MYDDDNIYVIDIATANPYQVGSELLEMAGDWMLLDESNNMTNEEIAADAAVWLRDAGVNVMYSDGDEADAEHYILRYLDKTRSARDERQEL